MKKTNEEKIINRLYNQMIENVHLTLKLPYMWFQDKKGKLTRFNMKKQNKKIFKKDKVYCEECLKFGRAKEIPCKIHSQITCSHRFLYSHLETIPIATPTATNFQGEKYDVVICEKCGLVLRNKNLTL